MVYLSFDSAFGHNDASSDGLLSLIFSIRTCHPQRVTFPQSLTTTPFERSSTGRFEVCSCKPTPEGLLPSSVQHPKLALRFVTHHWRNFVTWTKETIDDEVRNLLAGYGTKFQISFA